MSDLFAVNNIKNTDAVQQNRPDKVYYLAFTLFCIKIVRKKFFSTL